MSKSNNQRKTQTSNETPNQNETATPKADPIDKILAELSTTSGKVRYLDSIGWPRGQISKKLDIRYQHVRNVLITPVKAPKEQVGKVAE